MELIQIIYKSIIISLFCVGLRITSSEGMILYFIRKPFEDLFDIEKPTNLTKVIRYLSKPLIICITCMSSVWTLVIEYFYFNGITKWSILIIFVVSALNTMLYNLLLKLK